MKPLPRSRDSCRRVLPAVIAILAGSIGQVPGAEAAKADFFDVIARSPAEVAMAFPGRQEFEDMEQLLAGFVGLPMAEDHRKEFIASLQAAIKKPQPGYSAARLCLLNLLEEDGRYDEALAILRSGPRSTPEDGIREVRLLWLTGKETEAGELAARLAGMRTGHDGWHSPVQIDLIKNHVDRALEFLTFLENHAALPPEIRHGFALHHLELARRQGDVTRLIEESRSPILRAVWNAVIGKKDQALAGLAVADSITRPEDLELLLIALGPEPLMVERAKTLLATAKLTAGQRASLLQRFTKSSQRFELWAGMPAGHGETAGSLMLTEVDPFDTFNPFDTFEPFYPFATNDPFATDSPAAKPPEYRRICLDILAAHPDDARLQLLAALLSVNEPDHGKPFLLQAAAAVRKNPEADSGFADPAASALRWLVPLSEAAELDKLLMTAPGFTQLPAEDRIRYQMAAGLDTRVVAAFAACQFDQPSQDALSVMFADYFGRHARDRAIPAETLAMLLDRLPELVCGSVARKPSEISSLARAWIDFLASESLPEQRLVEAINRLVAAAAKRSPEVHRSVLGTLPETIWTLRGFEFSRTVITPARRPDIPEWWSCLAIFAPANPVYDVSITSRHPPLMPNASMNRQPFTPSQMPGIFALLNSPWEQNIAASLDLYPADPKAKAALAAKLRPLFDDTHPRATIYDLLVATGALPCLDPDIKALAERRLAVLTTTPQADPALAIYLFIQRLDHNEPLDQALAALQGLPTLPPSARKRLGLSANYAMERLRQFPGRVEAFMKQLGFIKPAKPQEPKAPEPLSPYDRFQLYAEAGTMDSPESIALAREVLFKFVDSKRPKPEPEQNLAITTLVQTGKFAAFLADLKSRMATAGSSELDVQRALYSVHLYTIIHSHGETLPYAKRIFELDPTDATAAREVLGAATREEDRPVVLKCLETLCRQSRPLFCGALGYDSSRGPLHLFTGAQARELAQALLQMPPPAKPSIMSYGERNTSSLLPLYQHMLEHDPDSLKPLMHWAGALSITNTRELLQLAETFKSTQRQQDGVEILAEALFKPPPAAADEPLRFPQPVRTVLPDSGVPCLSELTRGGWLKPLVEASAAFPQSPATDGVRLMIGLAADPQAATWERLVPAFLAKQPLSSRAETRRQLKLVIGTLPDSAALRLHLANETKSPATAPATLNSIAARLRLVAEAADNTPLAPLWDAAKDLLAKAAEQDQLRFLTETATPMAKLAGDTAWADFLTTIRDHEGFADAWLKGGHQEQFATLPPQRQHDLAAVILPNLKPDGQSRHDLTYIFESLVAADPPDVELLRKIRPWLEDTGRQGEPALRLTPKIQLLDLLCGDPSAVSPTVFASSEEKPSWRIEWSLAGYKGNRTGFPFGRRFPFLDGQFDLDILAGPEPDRLERVATIGKATCTGKLNVKMPDGACYVSLLATQHDGDIVRWAHPVALEESRDSMPVKLAPLALGQPGASVETRTILTGGPFFLEDAISLSTKDEVTVELARLPWTEGPAPVVAGWILIDSGDGALKLSYRSAENVEIGATGFETNNSELVRMPLWQHFKTPGKVMPPAETASISLVFQPSSNKTLRSFRVSGVRVVPPISAPPPAGFIPLGRIRGAGGIVAVDPGTNRFAAASAKHGVGVFDLTSKQFSGWITLGRAGRDRPDSIIWMGLTGDRIVVVARSGEVYLVAVSKRTAKAIGKIEPMRLLYDQFESSVKLSPDGNFLAWAGVMAGIHLARLGEQGITAERVLETRQIRSLQFKVNPNTLEAAANETRYLLPLDDWEKAALQSTRDETMMGQQEPPRRYVFGPNAIVVDHRVVDALYQVSFDISTGEGRSVEMRPPSRMVYLPPGLLALDQEGKPFHISAFGQIHRIETTQLKGYQAPMPKQNGRLDAPDR